MAGMGESRVFVAVRPPAEVIAALEALVAPRRDSDARLSWVDPAQWHITTLFIGALPDHCRDDLQDVLADIAGRTAPFEIVCGGAGTFPNPFQARLLYLGVRMGGRELAQLSRTCRGAANHLGATPDGSRFVPHLSLARTRTKFDATKWLRVLDSFGDHAWRAHELELIESHLGQGIGGGARHELVDTFSLAGAAH